MTKPNPPADAPGAMWRTVLTIGLGALLIAILVPCLQWLGRIGTGSSAELDVPTPIAIGFLTALVAISTVLGLLRASGRFSAQTLVILYVMLTISMPLCNFGLVHGLYASLTAVASEHLDRQVKTIEQGYAAQDARFFPKLSDDDYRAYRALAAETARRPADSAELQARQRTLLKPLKRFWSGVGVDEDIKNALVRSNASWLTRAREAWGAIPWETWAPILAWWGVLMLIVLAGMLLLAVGLGRDWIERENLSFPAAQLALALITDARPDDGADPPPRLVRNPFFLGGATLSAFCLLLGGLAHYHYLDLAVTGSVTFQRIDFRAIFVSPPWNILGENILFLSPLMIGIFLLVHQDILKGCLWVFAVLMGIRFAAGIGESGLRDALGARWMGNGLPYFAELATGAIAVFACVLIWRNRKTVFGTTLRLGLWAITGVVTAGWWYLEGVGGWGGLFFVLFFVLWTFLAGVALMRARAEGGLPMNDLKLSGSEVAFHTGSVNTHGIANVMAFNQTFFVTISALPGLMASTLEGLYLARRFHIARGRLLAAVAVGFIVAVGVGLVSFLVLSYAHGSQYLHGSVVRWSHYPLYDTFHAGDVAFQSGSDLIRVLMIPIGAGVMAALLAVRRRCPRFPIPPLSFLIITIGTLTFYRAGNALHDLHRLPINVVWGPILLALVIKSLVLRFGGMDLYVRSRPAALGLIWGQAITLVGWNVFHALASPEMTLFTGVFQ